MVVGKRMKRKSFYAIIFLSFWLTSFFLVAPGAAPAQQQTLVQGTVINGVTRQPTEFAIVVLLEQKIKVYTDTQGRFKIAVPASAPRQQTLLVSSEGMRRFEKQIDIADQGNHEIVLEPVSVRGSALEVHDSRDIQKVSRHTMTVKQLKEVPASFGDAINALASLPGINRTNGFFGPLVVRGSSFIGNNYFLDGIPIYDPMHFGGIHSVINNNMMEQIDMYASAFPVQFGSAYSSVIDIQTKEKVEKMSVIADISILSSSVLVERPFGVYEPDALVKDEKSRQNSKGYIIASGRYSYYSLFLPTIIDWITGDKPASVPSYWDYQLKLKYFLAKNHSLTLLLFGSGDKFEFIETDQIKVEEGQDPLLKGVEFNYEKSIHSQGLYYLYQPSSRFSSKITLYNMLSQSYQYINFPGESVAAWAQNIYVDTRPDILGLKSQSKANFWEELFHLSWGVDYTYYYFSSKGKTARVNQTNTDFDIGDDDLYTEVFINESVSNHVVGAYLEGKIKYAGLEAVTGVRSDYLERARQATFDPRGRISYEFPTGTTISLAGGHYSYFFQTNRFIFDTYADLAKLGKELQPEQAVHRVAGIEQQWGLYHIKIEGYYNTFSSLAVEYTHTDSEGNTLAGLNSGQIRAGGFEIMLRKDLRENSNGLFGWISYTYTSSKYRSGLPTENGYLGVSTNIVGDPYGNRWVDYDYEQPHFVKLILGYIWGRHTLSSKIQYYSSQPYTPIVSSVSDDEYTTLTGLPRYVPIRGEVNSRRFDDHFQIDLRYSNKKHYRWGYVSWYIEVINILNSKVANDVQWDSRYPYSSTNPEIKKPDGLAFFPSFGIEVKF